MPTKFSNMERNFHQSIQKGKLCAAADILLNRRIDEDVHDNLTLIKMKLSLIEQAIIQGRINCVESELDLKNNIAYQLLKIYKETKD